MSYKPGPLRSPDNILRLIDHSVDTFFNTNERLDVRRHAGMSFANLFILLQGTQLTQKRSKEIAQKYEALPKRLDAVHESVAAGVVRRAIRSLWARS